MTQITGKLNEPILPLTITIFKYCGIWRPMCRGSKIAFAYNIYTFLTIASVMSVALSQFLHVTIVVESVDDFSKSSRFLFTMLNCCCKMITILVKRQKISDLRNRLITGSCMMQTVEETEIRNKFDKIARDTTICYGLLTQVACFSGCITPILTDMKNRTLPSSAWIPYDLTVVLIYLIFYIQQCLGLGFGALTNVAAESFVTGLMLQTCAQMEILQNRLRMLSTKSTNLRNAHVKTSENALLKQCVLHHEEIFQFSKSISEVINPIILGQFMTSGLVVSFTVYELSRISLLSAGSFPLLTYLMCMLTQLFYYCWFANEVIFKSQAIKNTAYETDWTLLEHGTKKSLLLVMIRSERPIRYTCLNLITLSLDLYTTIIKTSYSAFNVLQGA